ncbi:MAG: hypothetical protein ACOCV8_04090 [Spirochaetota bacterium]
MPNKFFQFIIVLVLASLLFVSAYFSLHLSNFLISVSVIGMSLLPLITSLILKLDLKKEIPDIIFGAIDTGLLTIPALIGGSMFGVVGAIIGGVVGDSVTDGIAGFFEGAIAEWLRNKGIEESREALTSSLGKMTGCLMGAGVVLLFSVIIGIDVKNIFIVA